MRLWDEVGTLVNERQAELVDRAVSAESRLSVVWVELVTAQSDVADASSRIDELEGEIDSLSDALAAARARIAELEADAGPAGWVSLYDSSFEKNDGWVARQETQSNDNSYNTPGNVSYGPEGMVILGKRETLGKRPYTSGDVLGQHIRVPNYFRAEVTATVPVDYGMWPCALWFRPLTHGDSGEIDVMETWPFDWNGTPRLYSTVWDNYTTKRKENARLDYSKLPNPDPAAPHTYVVEKTRGSIAFSVDGVTVYSWSKATMNARIASWFDAVYEIPDRFWYPRVTLQVGGSSAGEPKPEWQESRMVIHRLRIYKEA